MVKRTVRHPKVVVIGAGSLFFGRQAIWQMINSPHLNKGTLALVDTDESRLRRMARLASLVIEHERVGLTLEASVDRRDVLTDADFVVLSFADRSVMFRGIECEVSAKYGIRMCSGDTIGPGGLFRTLRELPEVLACARDIERLCPDAWVINYVNPTAAHGIALMRHAPALKSFALCDGLHMPHVKQRYAVRAGLIADARGYTEEIDRRFDMRIAGVNHFTWMVRGEFDGRDVMPVIAESLRRDAARETDGGDKGAKAAYNGAISYELYRVFGVIPTCVGHTKEYVPFWQGKGVCEDTIPPLLIWDTAERYARHEEMWRQVDDFLSGRIPIGDYMKMFGPDHATDIIESMWAGLGKAFFVNTANRGAVSNMADDAFLELLCDIDMQGPRPRPVGPMPRGLLGMQQRVLDTHELAVEAVVSGNRALVRRALATDPLTTSLADTDAIISELCEREREVLPKELCGNE